MVVKREETPVLTQIDLMSDTPLELPIVGVTPKSSFLIRKVTGLNPPDKSLFIGDYYQDGGIYQGRRVGSRNVVFTIDLNPNPALGETVASLRQRLYKVFNDPQPEADYLKMLFHDDDNNERYLVGYCEKFEAEPFDVETQCQISMICPDPYLKDNQDTILTNESGWITLPFTYNGTAETGFNARLYVTVETEEVTLANNNKTMVLKTPQGQPYQVGDLIIISTIRGERSVSWTRPSDLTSEPSEFTVGYGYNPGYTVFYGPGVWEAVDPILSTTTDITMVPSLTTDYWKYVSTPVMAHLQPKSTWLDLHSEQNTISVYAGSDTGNHVAALTRLHYTSAFWGV
jgi:hypothetical protein